MDTSRTIRPVKEVHGDYIYSDFEKSSSSSGFEFVGKRKRSTSTCGDDPPRHRNRLKKSHDATKFKNIVNS